MLIVVLVLAAFVVVPFIIWGEQMDAHASNFVHDQATRWAIALIGIGLLVLDVILPVPSSLVSISLCMLLGPAWGVPTVFSGMVGAFALGYLIGQLLPAARLRAWVGPETWDAIARRQTAGMLWIAASRPVPVLAEVTAIFAGTLRLPFGASLAAAAASSLFVAVAYGLAAWVGLEQAGSSTTLLVFSAACLPAASWAALKWLQRPGAQKL
ncbi:hypothetical protein [Polaromonas sp. CG_9.11]|uniref:hypothetical protein n=1 Tax=Polaromonas sp. CG_9.11 TaxID=2787730 RepID=UPI0018C8F33C|nr:hypothetical protein [Polaromonas sp. CG_9.11]MBG6077805.1 putative membrane protein YdjX (TVP38/TMEM64 family) [Polaromonas sp. CG_9.11]